ncbi:glycerol kinase [Antricoccus suffuscus]|uniref:Glycerol kinase n=1 Tax=Antricoccus suffuscus TaxID=1629062 RepID=A0A2T1A471_9ACTN|nr:FGGY family carbohydrate kinase [Antricoccus suffuscus]PRZ43334.1 glycerol kinase [Antricoccus suffuscus]
MTNVHVRGLLSIDEGTTGTRSAIVLEDGRTGEIFYRAVSISSPRARWVEHDAAQIWADTLATAKDAIAWARAHDVDVVGVSICTQRATLVIWDKVTGVPLAPAISWQDLRYSEDLTEYAADWDDYLVQRTGRPVGARSAFLWLSRVIRDQPEVREAYRSGRLMFGTIDSWLIWNLTSGATHAISATNAVGLGGYALRLGDWDDKWIAAQGCPRELVPPILDDDALFGTTDSRVLGAALPIVASMGDQHSALIALGAIEPGEASCVHGTGTFAAAILGPEPDTVPRSVDNVLTLVGWRSRGASIFSLEAHATTTGAALRWLCEELQLFSSAAQISELAAEEPMGSGAWFVPALAGIRTPTARPEATGALTGLSLSTTRAQIARAVMDGIAHTVCDLFDGLQTVLPVPVSVARIGGGLATSNVLMQAQSDLLGVPLERVSDYPTASLRGAAYLGGVRLGMWAAPEDVVRAQESGDWFEPVLPTSGRDELRAHWASVIDRHTAVVRQSASGAGSTNLKGEG